jgi:hypothetical protein
MRPDLECAVADAVRRRIGTVDLEGLELRIVEAGEARGLIDNGTRGVGDLTSEDAPELVGGEAVNIDLRIHDWAHANDAHLVVREGLGIGRRSRRGWRP